MSYYLVFSTTHPSHEVVNTFLHEAARHEDADGDCWVLVRHRGQPITLRGVPGTRGDTFTRPPVTPFESEFVGRSPEQMGAIFLEYVASLSAETKRHLLPDTCVVLDDRSARDRTAVVMYYEENWIKEPGESGEGIKKRAERVWLSWRVPMRAADGVAAVLTTIPHAIVDAFEEAGPDADGVFHFPEAEEEIDEYENRPAKAQL